MNSYKTYVINAVLKDNFNVRRNTTVNQTVVATDVDTAVKLFHNQYGNRVVKINFAIPE